MPDAGKQAVSGIETREVIVQPLPPPDRLVTDWEKAPVCFITNDGTSLSGALAKKLISRGWKVVALQWPEDLFQTPEELPETIRRISLAGIAEDQVQAALIEAAKVYGPASAFICLEPAWKTGTQTDAVIIKEQEQYLQGIFWFAKYLKPALTGNSQDQRSAFMAVTHMDGVLGTSGEGDWSAVSGGLFGLVKTLNLEWQTVFCRALDVQADLPAEQAANYILAELNDPDRLLIEVGYGPQERVTLALAQPVRSSE